MQSVKDKVTTINYVTIGQGYNIIFQVALLLDCRRIKIACPDSAMPIFNIVCPR